MACSCTLAALQAHATHPRPNTHIAHSQETMLFPWKPALLGSELVVIARRSLVDRARAQKQRAGKAAVASVVFGVSLASPVPAGQSAAQSPALRRRQVQSWHLPRAMTASHAEW